MRVYPKPLEIGDMEGFTPEKDLFNRAELGKGMSHLVATIEDPLVIAFDGPWGSGKTTFLKMWAGELRKAGHPVIFFDAFENDYIEDAFAALAREVVELAESKTSPGSAVAVSFKDKATKLGVALLRGSLKVGAKVIVRAATAGLGDADDMKAITEAVQKEADETASHYIDDLLNAPQKQKQLVAQFRDALADLPGLLCPPGVDRSQKPLVFIIDELDRCKPHFALALLERIKHFLTVPNLHFVLGVNLSQIHSSVRYAYGPEINAGEYLQKFINFSILNTVTTENKRNTDLDIYANYIISRLEILGRDRRGFEIPISTIARLIRYEQMSYRTLERAYTVFALAIKMTPEDRPKLGPLMGGLIMMKVLRPDLFLKAKHGDINFSEVKNFLRFLPETDSILEMGNEEKWWLFILSDIIPVELEHFGSSLFSSFSFNDRIDVLTYAANEVIDRISPD